MPSGRRLRSLDEFQPPAWHRRTETVSIVPMLFGLALALCVGALIGWSI